MPIDNRIMDLKDLPLRILYTNTLMNLVGINVNGVRKKRKRLLLEKLLADLTVGVCVLSETHLRKADLATFSIEHYRIFGDYCRPTPVGESIRGGVLILVHEAFSAERIPERQDLSPVIERCMARFYPTDDPETEIQVTGVYIPPGRVEQLTMEQLMVLREPEMSEVTQDTLPHILVGDFNVTTWRGLFSEWTQEGGMHELLHPDIPTFALGSSLDKFLFVPGYYIPSTFLPPGDSRYLDRAGLMEEPYYPGVVVEYPHLSDHSPILLPIPSDTRDLPEKAERRIRVGKLTPEEWE